MFQIQRGGWWKEKKEEEEDRVEEEEEEELERWEKNWRWEGGLARVTCFKSGLTF